MIIEIVIGILIVIVIIAIVEDLMEKSEARGRLSNYDYNERRNEDD